jgi:hypothetical protein
LGAFLGSYFLLTGTFVGFAAGLGGVAVLGAFLGPITGAFVGSAAGLGATVILGASFFSSGFLGSYTFFVGG